MVQATQTPPPASLREDRGVSTSAKRHSPFSVSRVACPSKTFLEQHLREASMGHPKQMPKSPQVTPPNVEEQRLYS
ncbi:hypothetical protein CHARACLAT_008984 [Characodon lateralis]|uniref:Uncharacterized protein n=1 Tax=Characodon lateralis TaxID=208331 RepID=A0ABU7CW46_9TELE|nr:hypothetical protein [Characodon lateralis]